ncbi:MAG: AcrR family transcriptional regulator, partial [Alphaproteobacteria bacterium]|nr:AcrR family transcriptional regulator [Alphaproteobacteria bacterium]
RRTQQIEERLADKRERIVKAVRRVVGEVGFRDAQIAMVAAAAGIATGTVYRYFPSKAELFAEAVSANSRHEVDVMAQIVAADGSPVQRLQDAIRVFASRALQAKQLAYAMIAEPADVEVDTARLEYRRAFGRLFRRLIDEGMQQGELPAQDSEATSACIVGALIEGLIGPLAPDAAKPMQENRLIDTILRFCLGAVGAREATVTPLRPIKGGRA